MLHNIQLNDLPADGRLFEGEIRIDCFAVEGPGAPRFKPPLTFSLNVRVDGPDIIVDGSISALFDLQCARCAAWFPYDAGQDEFEAIEPRDGASTLDLTALMREHTLLALPGYPRCEESNVESRVCPEADRFAPDSDYIPLSDDQTLTPPQRDVWGALDRIKPDPGSQDPPNS